jgi:hypothetical protein
MYIVVKTRVSNRPMQLYSIRLAISNFPNSKLIIIEIEGVTQVVNNILLDIVPSN